ncbi:RNA polymerase sigma-70 factor [Agriterribacter humi]|uniref:RNA polymerase sigma-70 factor n=1 Tax=Agriterribacter humi TaxID=1104781 RepID=UPI0012657AD7|nr:RNA polymerase sigma-70 factor [Agriterribacter humi]
MPLPTAHTDKTLLFQIAAGNEAAFKTLFDRYRQRLFYYVSRFIKSDQVAEELVMDTFMKIWTGRDIILQINNFDAFLFRIAHNKSIDFLRSAANDAHLKTFLWEEIQVASGERADTAVLLEEYEEKLRQAIALLSPQRRRIYHLRREQDFTHDQIAAQLGISKATVNNHIVEAQRFIRTYLVKNMELTMFILFASLV